MRADGRPASEWRSGQITLAIKKTGKCVRWPPRYPLHFPRDPVLSPLRDRLVHAGKRQSIGWGDTGGGVSGRQLDGSGGQVCRSWR